MAGLQDRVTLLCHAPLSGVLFFELSAFLHLVDEAGMRIAHQDVPAGGTYDTPLLSWAAGPVLRSNRNLTILESLPPGKYRLWAGLYYCDDPHESLVTLNANGSPLEIGMVEVSPR